MITIKFKSTSLDSPGKFVIGGETGIDLEIITEVGIDTELIKIFSENDFDKICKALKNHLMEIKNK